MKDQNIHRLKYKEKEIVLIGSSYISKDSAEEIKKIIETERPDSVCMELDAHRYHTIINIQGWRDTDIIQIIRTRRLLFLIIDLIICSLQNRIGNQLRIQVGKERIQTIESAKDVGATLILADRDIRITFRRIWRVVGIKGKIQMLAVFARALFSRKPIPKETIEQLEERDFFEALLRDYDKFLPQFEEVFINEREQFFSQKVREAPGSKIIAIVGARYIQGIKEEIYKERDIEKLQTVPPRPSLLLLIPFLIPLLVIGIISATYAASHTAGIKQMSSWILWNGILSSIGAAAGLAHPITIIITFFAAPIAALMPLISTSGVVLLVETLIRRPTVGDFERLAGDVYTIKGLWKNEVTRILIAAGLSNVGSIIGSLLSSAEIIQLFIKAN